MSSSDLLNLSETAAGPSSTTSASISSNPPQQVEIDNRALYTDVATTSRPPSDCVSSDDDFDDDQTNVSDFDGPTLKRVVQNACKPYDLGTAVLPKLLLQPDIDEAHEDGDDNDDGYRLAAPSELQAQPPQSRYARFVEQECTAIVIEHHLKWAPLCTAEPGPHPDGKTPVTDRLGRYDFGVVDDMVDWALARNMKVKGHVLVWAVTSPVAFLETMTAPQLREHLRRHIFTTMGHFRGRIHVWDVVNEALAPDGTLAPNVFLNTLGPTYIEECFQWAHEADPSAILLYNDNKVEGMGPDSPNHLKSEGFYNLLKDLTHRKIPVHGCGIQAHFNAAGVGRNRPPTPRMVQRQIRRLGNLGLKVNISEMDVRVSKLAPNLRQIAQRQIYHDIVAAALSEPSFDGIWLWGFTDRHTWVSYYSFFGSNTRAPHSPGPTRVSVFCCLSFENRAVSVGQPMFHVIVF